MGPSRHLSLIDNVTATQIEWPVPFADGVDLLLARRGQPVVVLASGDPFWYGAGTVLARHLQPGEWQTFPAPSTFSNVANRMGWGLEKTQCIGLHAAALSQLRPHLASGRRIIALLRDGQAVPDLASYLTALGFGDTRLSVFEAIGGPREIRTDFQAGTCSHQDFAHPVCAAIAVAGDGQVVPRCTGVPDDLFDTDGQMTKRPVRAMTLSALAPRPYELLWDIGGGSGSIAIEWLLSDPSLRATSIEPRPDRAARIAHNATTLGVPHLQVVEGKAMEVLKDLDTPDAVFVGGGLDQALLDHLTKTLDAGTRIVINAVTLETESLLLQAHARLGGSLMRLELSHATDIGSRTGWKSTYPIVQWSLTL